jgi:uncharacterized membrane protein
MNNNKNTQSEQPKLPFSQETNMDTFTATMIAEGVEEASSEEQYIEAWQVLIDTGMAYQLQGWFKRTAQRLIEAGYCTPRQTTTNDQPYSC